MTIQNDTEFYTFDQNFKIESSGELLMCKLYDTNLLIFALKLGQPITLHLPCVLEE